MENFFYAKDGVKLTTKITKLSEDISQELYEAREVEVKLIKKLFDVEYELACQYVWMFQAPHIFTIPDKLDILLAAFHKNLIAMYSSLQLTENGFHGSAKLLFRHVFEYLMTSKFCSLSKNEKVYTSWRNEEAIYFTNGVLKKIKSPDNEEFKRFWNRLNDVSHASRSSLQIDINWNTEKEQIESNLVVLHILLECNYHLLNSHLITNSMRWHMSYYFEKNYEKVTHLKEHLTELFSISKKMISKSDRKLIYAYKRKWLVE